MSPDANDPDPGNTVRLGWRRRIFQIVENSSASSAAVIMCIVLFANDCNNSKFFYEILTRN